MDTHGARPQNKGRPQAPARYRYGTPGKTSVRSHWGHFVGYGKPLSVMQNTHVLFFPAERALELPIYRGLGIPLEHMQGIECDPRTAEAIRTQAFGFPLFEGYLDAFLATRSSGKDPETFDACWLDFDGAFNTFADDIIRTVGTLRLANGSCLGVTSFVGRDRPTIMDSAVAMSIFRSCLTAAHFQRLVDHLSDQLAPDGVPTRGEKAVAHYNTIARELSFMALIIRALGERVHPDFRTRFTTASAGIAEAIADIMQRRHHKNPHNVPFPLVEFPEVRELLQTTTTAMWPQDLARFNYFSHARQKLFTWFLRMEARYHAHEQRPLLTVLDDLARLWITRGIHRYAADGQLTDVVFCKYCKNAS